jgi:hypothetical protein
VVAQELDLEVMLVLVLFCLDKVEMEDFLE